MTTTVPPHRDGAVMIAAVVGLTAGGLAVMLWASLPPTGDGAIAAALGLNAAVALAAGLGGIAAALRRRRAAATGDA